MKVLKEYLYAVAILLVYIEEKWKIKEWNFSFFSFINYYNNSSYNICIKKKFKLWEN